MITLIYAGWLPHDLPASRSFLSLVPEVRQKPYSNRSIEGSPERDRASGSDLKNFIFFVLTSCKAQSFLSGGILFVCLFFTLLVQLPRRSRRFCCRENGPPKMLVRAAAEPTADLRLKPDQFLSFAQSKPHYPV